MEHEYYDVSLESSRILKEYQWTMRGIERGWKGLTPAIICNDLATLPVDGRAFHVDGARVPGMRRNINYHPNFITYSSNIIE